MGVVVRKEIKVLIFFLLNTGDLGPRGPKGDKGDKGI